MVLIFNILEAGSKINRKFLFFNIFCVFTIFTRFDIVIVSTRDWTTLHVDCIQNPKCKEVERWN